MDELPRKREEKVYQPDKPRSQGDASATPQAANSSDTQDQGRTRETVQAPLPGPTVRVAAPHPPGEKPIESQPTGSSYGRLLSLVSFAGGILGTATILLVAAVLPVTILLLSPLPAVLVLVWLLGTAVVYAAGALLMLRARPPAGNSAENQHRSRRTGKS